MADNFKKIIHILSDGKFHSGVDLGAALGITRAAIWKLIHRLKALGIEIEAVSNKGYCIPQGMELLDMAKIKSQVNADHHPYFDKTLIFDEISSTNTFLLQCISDKKDNINICLAESQTAGRGRFKRVWMSPFGRNVYLSLRWHFRCDLSELSGLSLVMAVAIQTALERCEVKGVTLKWPNDVLWQKRKIGGSLIELRGESHHECDAVIGIGLNVHMPTKLKEKAGFSLVDVYEIQDKIPERNRIIGTVIDEILSALIVFQKQGFKPFMQAWQALDPSFNQMITIITGTGVIQGINRGINEKGCLRIENEQGEIMIFSNGEVSVAYEHA